VLGENLLRHGLGEEEQEGVGSVLEPDVEQAHPDTACARVEHDAHVRVPQLHESLAHPEGREHLERAGLDRQRTGLVSAIPRPVDDPEPHAEGRELSGQRQAGGPGSDDEDVDVGRALGLTPGRR
jgi:hypothetical protein